MDNIYNLNLRTYKIMDALAFVCVWLNDQKRTATIHFALSCKTFIFIVPRYARISQMFV